MSTEQEKVEERRHSRRSSGDDKSERKKKKKIREEEGSVSRSSREESSSSLHDAKRKKKKSRDDDGSVRESSSVREKKKKKKPTKGTETADEILARLASKSTVNTVSTEDDAHDETLYSTEATDSSSREKKKKKKSSRGDESSSHRSKKSHREESSTRSKKHKKSSKEHRHSSRSGSSRDSSIESGDDKKPAAVSEEEDVKVGPVGAVKTPGVTRVAGVERQSSGDGNFTVKKVKRWDDYSTEAKMEDKQFSSSSIASGFSLPASNEEVRVGAIHSTAVPDRIQNMLDRKFNEFDEPKEEGASAAAAAPPSSAVGAHRETTVPVRIQNMLDEKFHEFGQSRSTMTASNEDSQGLSAVQQKLQTFQPTQVRSNPQKLRDKLQDASLDDPDPTAHTNIAPAARQFSMWNTGHGKVSVVAPSPDVLTNQLMADQEMGLSSAEKTESRLAAGLCPHCGRTKTHEKIKYGPFQAFRKMEPLTTPGHVYKGYCLFCNNLHDLRRFLHEPYLREQDIDGSLVSPLAAASEDDTTSGGTSGLAVVTQEDQNLTAKKRRIQICLCTAILAVIAGGIGLAITFVGNSEQPTVAAAPPPTAAPGPLGWYQVGSDISEPIESFGYKVSLSANGHRVAVSAPKANTNVGRVDVFEFLNTTSQWETIGNPILGDFQDDLTGYAMVLSDDGKHIVIGYPGNDNGFVRVFRYTKGEWKQTGSTITGTIAAGWFGAALSMTPDGTSIIVGAPYDTNENGSEAGRVQVFVLQDTDWVQLGSDLIGRAALDHFGTSVDISDDGTKIAIGAPNNDDRWQDGGQVHIYEYVTNKQGVSDWKESLKSLKILGDEEGHEFGSAMKMSGMGDTIVSSSLLATNDEGTAGGGDPRVVYIAYIDHVAEELGYGFPEIPGELGLGQSVDIDYDGVKVILSTLNSEKTAGKVMLYDIAGKANWFIDSDEYGGEKLGPDEWLGAGPSVSLGTHGDFFAIGFESIVIGSTKKAAPVVRVYFYGHGPSEEDMEET